MWQHRESAINMEINVRIYGVLGRDHRYWTDLMIDLLLVIFTCVIVWRVTESGWVSGNVTTCSHVTLAKEYSGLGP